MLTTILIIDKRKELSVKYKKCLENSEASVTLARTLKDAMLYLQSLEPEIVIVSDSIEENLADFCKKIRTLTYNTRPVIVALSKSADISDRIEVLENGADDFLSEPVNTDEFKTRIKAHLRRDIESNLDNKTLLPNLKYTKKALKRVLTSEHHSVLYAEIENLKDYKSVYTELAGDKIVQTFVAIAKSALDEADFIGQVSDTGFVIITNKYSTEKLAEFLTFAFDTVAPKFYSESDTQRGYMLINGERYAGMRANFVSVLVGGMVDGFNLFSNVDILLNKLKEIKDMAKIPAGSNYIIDRAKLTGEAEKNIVSERKIYIKEKDDSLRFLIQTSLELQGYEVQNDIDTEKGLQPSIVIMDSGSDLTELELVKKMKSSPKFVNTKFIITTTVHNKSVVLDSGADLYLPKPYEISDLIRWVEYFIKN